MLLDVPSFKSKEALSYVSSPNPSHFKRGSVRLARHARLNFNLSVLDQQKTTSKIYSFI
jgi:hypothetical protein